MSRDKLTPRPVLLVAQEGEWAVQVLNETRWGICGRDNGIDADVDGRTGVSFKDGGHDLYWYAFNDLADPRGKRAHEPSNDGGEGVLAFGYSLPESTRSQLRDRA